MRVLKLALAIAVMLAAVTNALALIDPGDVGRFFGVWIGNRVIAEKQMQGSTVTARDLDVAIWETRTGFDVSWNTLRRDGAKRILARFVSASDPNTFTVSRVDPHLSGKEKLWAQMEGDRLVFYLSSVGDDVAERVARYECSVSDSRMSLKYTLSRGGELLESVTGTLSRSTVVM